MKLRKSLPLTHHHRSLRTIFWFTTGAVIGLFFFISFAIILYQKLYANKIYPGIYIDNIDFGGKTPSDVENFFVQKNANMQNTTFILKADDQVASISARSLRLGYDGKLLSEQAYSIGRSTNLISNVSIIFQAYTNGLLLPASYTYDSTVMDTILKPLKRSIDKPAVDALFKVENERVTAFRSSQDGKILEEAATKDRILAKIPLLSNSKAREQEVIIVPITVIKPNTSTNEANKLGIQELVGRGTSLYVGSIPNRIFNLTKATNKFNGVLIKPGEVFSFDDTIGDVSAATGYKQAYVIQNGKTVLGDGGGLCQVSTTFFRAILDAGFPILERNPHAYRVHYYEEDSGPGVDAAVFTPNVDLKFKNDSGHYLLVQTRIDTEEMKLTFELYGTKDGREVTINKPVILSQTPAPEPLYQDDPTLPKGQIKQIDFAAAGASVYFTREVRKNGKVIISDKFVSNYRPWQAVYLRGTKE